MDGAVRAGVHVHRYDYMIPLECLHVISWLDLIMVESMDLGNSACLFDQFGWLQRGANCRAIFLSTHILDISLLSGQWCKFELILTS